VSDAPPSRAARRAAVAGSPPVLLALALPPALAAALQASLQRPVAAALDARATWIWAALLASALLAGAVAGALARRWPGALARLGLLVLLVQGAVAWGWRFRATGEVGDGGAAVRWLGIRLGPWARPPALSDFEVDPAARVRLRVEGHPLELADGASGRAGGVEVRVTAVGAAPQISAYWQDQLMDQTLVPVGSGEDGFTQLGRLPHRFYLSLPEGPRLADPVGPPDALRVHVERGKLVLAERLVQRGVPAELDHVLFRFDGGGRWARLEVRRVVPPAASVAALAGLALVVAAAVVALRGARRRG